MNGLRPLEVFADASRGRRFPLPRRLARLYGPLRVPRPRARSYVLGNFATTLDGVVSLQVPGQSGARDITGADPHDRLVMGILRAAADAVIVGAGTLRAVPRHRWTAQRIYPPLSAEYSEFRLRLGKSPFPLNVIVTATGKVDLELPVFAEQEAPVLIVTTEVGGRRLSKADPPPRVRIATIRDSGRVSAEAIIAAVKTSGRHDLLLVEGGPHLIGTFFAEQRLDELFLTLAPQIAGRDGDSRRPGLVAGQIFAPERPKWGSLIAVRRGGSHLFLRYAFPGPAPA